MKFVLYSRSYCHLCDDMLHALHALDPGNSFSIEVIDVDTDPRLVELYDELVPVLFGQKDAAPPVQLCHYFLDEKKLLAFLSQAKGNNSETA